jgi:hypothetical protein
MMPRVRAVAAVVATAVLFTAAVVSMMPERARAAYAAGSWHATVELQPVGSPNWTYSVPSGVDLTITDIVYTFAPALQASDMYGGRGFGSGLHLDGLHARVYESGPNTNPTNFSPNMPLAPSNQFPVGDSAQYQVYFDLFRQPLLVTEPAYNDVFWTLRGDLEDEIEVLEHKAQSLEFVNAHPSTVSHHFQSGLVFVSGNSLNVAASVTGSSVIHAGNSNVIVHLSGVLQ